MRSASGGPLAALVGPRRRGVLRAPALAFAAAGLTACTAPLDSPLPPDALWNLVRYGPERTRLNYHDRFEAEKLSLLEQMNRDRAADGAPALLYEPRAALVGDRYCLEMALSRSTGHWDPMGRAPYVRWGLAGGVDYHSQNAVAFSRDDGPDDRPLLDRLLEAHAAMMAERPPRDGHRRLILDPTMTHVGIGAAAVGGQFRMSQEFTRVLLEWVEVPDRPLEAGSLAALVAQPLPGWRVAEVEVRWEPPLPGAATEAVHRGGGYGYPEVVRRLRPSPPKGLVDVSGAEPDFPVAEDGRFALRFELSEGPGFYFVVCLLRPWPAVDQSELLRASAAMIVAVP